MLLSLCLIFVHLHVAFARESVWGLRLTKVLKVVLSVGVVINSPFQPVIHLVGQIRSRTIRTSAHERIHLSVSQTLQVTLEDVDALGLDDVRIQSEIHLSIIRSKNLFCPTYRAVGCFFSNRKWPLMQLWFVFFFKHWFEWQVTKPLVHPDQQY